MLGLVRLYRDAFGGLPRLTWLLCAAAFLNRCGAMVVPFFGIYAKERMGYSEDQASILLAVYGLGAVTGSFLGGKLADRIGPVRIQVISLTATALWMYGMTQVLTPGWLEASAFVLATFNEAFRPGSISAVAASCGLAERRKALALNRLMLNLGWAFGPTIGGYLVEVDFRLMFVVDGSTCLLAAVFLATCLSGFNPRVVPTAGEAVPTNGGPWRDRHFLLLMIGNLVVLIAFMQYFTTGSRVFADQGFSKREIGWFLAVNPIVITLFEMLVVHSLRSRAALPIVAVGAAVVGGGYLCLLLPLGPLSIVLAMLIIAGGELLQMPLLSAHINDHAPAHQRGVYNGAYGMCFSGAQILAPLFGGFLYGRAGANALWWSCGALGGLSALLFLIAARHSARRVNAIAGQTSPHAVPPPANETTSPPKTARSDPPPK